MLSPANTEVFLEKLPALLDDLGEPLRLRIINILAKLPMTVIDLTERLNVEGESVSRSNVSNALAVLEAHNLVFYRKSGKYHIYSVNTLLMRQVANQIMLIAEEAEKSGEA